MTRPLPAVPHIDHLKKQAKQLLATLKTSDPDTKLSDAQFALAKDYGFANWQALVAEVEARRAANTTTDTPLRSVIDAAGAGDIDSLTEHYERNAESVLKPYGEHEVTALQEAAYLGQGETVDWLLERGADPFFRGKGDNAYPLHFAAEKGHLDIVKRFVELGSDVNVKGDEHGAGVIGWATVFMQTQHAVVEYLLSVGAKHTIFSAVAMEDHGAIDALLSDNADCFSERLTHFDLRKTPLHLAAERNLADTINYMLAKGADPNATDDQANTPLTYALRRNNTEAIQALRAATDGADFLLALHDGDMDKAKEALANMPNANESLGFNLLDAAAYGTPEQLQKLEALGANLKSTVEKHPTWGDGCTALHAAAALGNLKTIRFLLDQGADPNQTEPTYHANPAGWANHFNQKEAQELLEKAASQSEG